MIQRFNYAKYDDYNYFSKIVNQYILVIFEEIPDNQYNITDDLRYNKIYVTQQYFAKYIMWVNKIMTHYNKLLEYDELFDCIRASYSLIDIKPQFLTTQNDKEMNTIYEQISDLLNDIFKTEYNYNFNIDSNIDSNIDNYWIDIFNQITYIS